VDSLFLCETVHWCMHLSVVRVYKYVCVQIDI